MRTRRFHLVGEIDQRLSSFPLKRGENIIGSLPASDVRLEGRGVSRRHARLRVRDVSFGLEDLGSKNGTLLNGRPIRSSALELGDEIEICGQRLRLEELDPGDAELGVSLSGPSRISSGPWQRETTRLGGAGGGESGALLDLLDDIVERLWLAGEPDPVGVLERLGPAIGAEGVALVEHEAGGAPLLLASAGVVDPGLLTVHGRGPVPGIEPEPPPEGVAVARLGSVAHSLSLWLFGAPAGPFAERLLEVVLRWLGPAHLGTARPGPSRHDSARSGVAESAGGTPPRGDGLVFPCGYLRGGSRAMVAVYSQMRLLTQGDVPVLVFGETGVGKELLARALHLSSSRVDGPMVTINCAAIPAELLEAELFGIGRGVATGVSARPGRFAEAEGGTLFLDEIGDMPAALQAKLLRALQEREVQPLGGQPMAVDVRVISATNTQLEESMRAGRFRRDLYYRLAGYVLRVPSLAERRDDVPHLVEHFLRTFSDEIGKPIRGVTVKALETLRDYPWPGNVRQLEHEVRRLVYVARAGQAIDSGLLSPEILTGGQGENAAEPNPGAGSQRSEERSSSGSTTLSLGSLDLATLEKEAIQRALEASGGVLTEAAQTLGISRDALRRRLVRHGLRPGGGEG